MFKKTLITITSLITTFSLLLPSNIFAKEDKILFRPTEKQIIITFQNPSDQYKIYLDNKEIWSGTGATYTIDGLFPDAPYNLVVQDVTSGETISKYTYTLKGDNSSTRNINTISGNSLVSNNSAMQNLSVEELDKLFYDSVLEAEVSKKEIKLNIGSIPDEDGVLEVYRNGEKIGETNQNAFIDTNIGFGETYKYEVRGLRKKSKEELDKEISELKRNGVEVTDKILEQISYQEYLLSKSDIQTIDVSLNDLGKAATSNSNFILRSTTFIPFPKIYLTGSGLIGGKYFKGDNRGFCATCSSYRTRADVNVKFTPNRDAVSNISVGKTYEVINGQYDYVGTAGTSGFKMTSKSTGPDRIVWGISHSIGIPWHDWLSPDIDYTYSATVWKSGSWKVTGTADGAPAYEFYIAREGKQNTNSGWRTIYTHYPSGNPDEFGQSLYPPEEKKINNSGTTP